MEICGFYRLLQAVYTKGQRLLTEIHCPKDKSIFACKVASGTDTMTPNPLEWIYLQWCATIQLHRTPLVDVKEVKYDNRLIVSHTGRLLSGGAHLPLSQPLSDREWPAAHLRHETLPFPASPGLSGPRACFSCWISTCKRHSQASTNVKTYFPQKTHF